MDTDPWVNQAYLDPHQGFLKTGEMFEGFLPNIIMWETLFGAQAVLKGEGYRTLMGIGPSFPKDIFRKRTIPTTPRSIFQKNYWKKWGGTVRMGANAPQWMKGEAFSKFLKGGGGRALGIAGSALRGFNAMFLAQIGGGIGAAIAGGAEALTEYGGERIALEQYGPRSMSPEFTDSGRAATMRQQSVMAIRQSQQSLATHFGREAMAVHR